jgi:hypothetical protein
LSFDIKVAASGIIALCLALSALLFMSSVANPSLQGTAVLFFGLAVVLIFVMVILGIVGIKIRSL